MKKLFLRDRNRELTKAWQAEFADLIEAGAVEVSCGDISEGPNANAILSPANSFGYMDGGIDLVYLTRFGLALQDQLQSVIREQFDGELHVGQATIVSTGDVPFAWLVSAPTMRIPMDVSSTVNAYLSFRAALIAVRSHNNAGRPRIESLLCPGLATAIGRMPPTVAAKQMRLAWDTVIDGKHWTRPTECLRSQALLTGKA